MRQTLLVTAVTLLSGCAGTSSAVSCDGPASALCNGELAEVAVLDRTTGERLTVYTHDGQRWVAGAPGHRYAVSIRSKTSGRILGVVAVDGVNVITGATAAWSQQGYVFRPWQSYDILGWRKSQERVADFVFTDLEDSYAARTGRPQDVGVIGVAVFRDAADVSPPPPASNEAPAPLQRAAPPATGSAEDRRQILGTGHGQSEISRVVATDFERAQEHPDQVVVIRYDRRDRLVAMGVIPDGIVPRAFPHSASAGFVADPPSR